jgi:methylenetetrahydrofolate--tRNA-(uracil-5-)-methyltransferase
MATTIRPATPADVATILTLIRALATYEREPDAVQATEDDLLRHGFGENPYYQCLIAEHDGKPVGFALYFYDYSTWLGRPGLYLEDLFVDPPYRGLGIGKALLRLADETAVPAGHALAVDRVEFSRRIEATIEAEPAIRVVREEVTSLEGYDGITVVATGPLTSDALSRDIQRITGSQHLAFYDSISPIVDADTIDMERVYFAARWDKGTADYINCPMNREEYDRFYEALLAAEPAESKEWENLECLPPSATKAGAGAARYFEGCLPIEILARRGRDTLRFGPMKPVGLRDPRTGQTPWAVVQLRKENLRADSYNLVGFQNHLKWGDQAKVLRLIPGLENARFLRYGQIHRNTYICAPVLLDEALRLKARPEILFAGQISGVEGYTESIATGMLAGIYAAAIARGEEPVPVPRGTALGSLVHYITHADAKHFQPANISFDLLLPLEEELRKKVRDKKERHRIQCERALGEFDAWWAATTTALAIARR